jgi:hypothetical protein
MSQESQEINFSALTNIKSRGGLNHPPLAIFIFFFLKNRVHI